MSDSIPKKHVEFGCILGTQYATWTEAMEAAVRAEQLGYASLWSADHLLSTYGSIDGPRFEGYMVLAGWAHRTTMPLLGLSVGAVAFRNPALTVKIVTTLDHMSGGRAVLGVGAGWHEPEHRHYGYSLGRSAGERIAWLDEAAGIMRGMLDGTRPSGSRYYSISDAPNSPSPLQKRLPIMVGARGERKILKLVARHGDIWNIPADVGIEGVKSRVAALARFCDELGRDSSAVDWILHCGLVVLRPTEDEAREHLREIFRENDVTDGDLPDPGYYLGDAAGFIERLRTFADIGFRRFNISFMAPFDYETMDAITKIVKPALEAVVD
ncbi:MAG: LLM class flavin-dependent oxidoreductase [Candidatus Dormibacteraeota bacterium]|nr:LLM class flavin-dependent oxidoreductase [Candidatus Dormibacteraeota bacterium]